MINQNSSEIFQQIKWLLPEAVLFLTTLLILVFNQKKKNLKKWVALPLLGLTTALICSVLIQDQQAHQAIPNIFLVDSISLFFKSLLLFIAFIVVLMGWLSSEIHVNDLTEFYSLILLSTFSMCLLSSSQNFLISFLTYETAGFCFSVLAAFNRKSFASSDAGIKLFFQGTICSTFFALGIAMLYGATKSFSILEIHKQLSLLQVTPLYLWITFGILFIAIACRIALFPFYFLFVDVIRGAPAPVSSFLSVAPFVSTVALAFQICFQIFSVRQELQWSPLASLPWPDFFMGIAAVTMTIGSFASIYQTNLKQVLAFLCMSQIGFVLIGFCVMNYHGLATSFFMLAAFSFIMLGIFFTIHLTTQSSLSLLHYAHAPDNLNSEQQHKVKIDSVETLNGLILNEPYAAIVLCFFLLSLVGLPPLIGFIGKFYVFATIIKSKIYWLAIISAINWVLSLASCLLLIKRILAFSTPVVRSPLKERVPFYSTLILILFPVITLGIYWDPLMGFLTRSLEFLR